MNEPELVLFDEPTSALDSKLGEQVMGLIRQEVKGRGTAAVVVTHDTRMTHYADRVGRDQRRPARRIGIDPMHAFGSSTWPAEALASPGVQTMVLPRQGSSRSSLLRLA